MSHEVNTKGVAAVEIDQLMKDIPRNQLQQKNADGSNSFSAATAQQNRVVGGGTFNGLLPEDEPKRRAAANRLSNNLL